MGLNFIQEQLYDGLGNETAALILNISAVLKYVSSTFKLEKLLYNTVIIKNALLFQNYSQFFLQPIIPKIIPA